jgi:Protein of unknown function (DUF1266)
MLKQLTRLVIPQETQTPLSTAECWAIAASALLTVLNHGSHTTLSSTPRVGPGLWRGALKQWWGIESREEAIAQIQRLRNEGHRVSMAEDLGHEPLSWDLGRAINIVRWCYGSDYFSESESRTMMMDLARPLQQHYQSWIELGTDYVAGHDLWKGESDSEVDEALAQLSDPNNADSPWNRIPWETDLSE